MYQNLQALRALAALLVMLFHGASHYRNTVGSSWVMSWIGHFGYLGVDIFFAISGFVAAHTTLHHERARSEAPRYLVHRFARIYLGYWPFFLLSLLIAAVYAPHMLQQWNGWKSFFLVFLLGAVDPRELVLYVSWSLSYELIFYLLVAATFVLPVRRARQLLVVSTLALSVFLAGAVDKTEPQWLMALLSFLLEFLMGAVACLVLPHVRHAGWLVLIASAAVGGFALGIHGDPPQGALRAFTLGLGGAATVLLAAAAEDLARWRAPAWAVALGASSYTLYLAHVLFWSLFGYWGIGAWITTWSAPLRGLGFCLFTGLCLLVCHRYYLFVEAPIYRLAKGLR